jgi:hypothetical protein
MNLFRELYEKFGLEKKYLNIFKKFVEYYNFLHP